MDQRRQDREDARESTRDDRERRESRSRDTERRKPDWRDADQPDGWRHSNAPPLTDRERRESWPVG